MAPLSQARERTPAAQPAGNGQIVSGRSNGRRWADLMSASGQLSGCLWAVSRVRRQHRSADIARGCYLSATMRDRDGRYRAVRDVATSQVTGYRRSGLNQAANMTAVLIKRCQTVLAERCAGDDSRTPHSPDPGGVGGRPAPALLLAGVQASRAHRQIVARRRVRHLFVHNVANVGVTQHQL